MRRLIVALALLAATPAAASEPAIPADALVPNDEARSLFEALSSNVMTDAMLDSMIRGMPADAARAIDDAIDQILAPGEAVSNWRDTGVDPLPAIAASEGGLAGNMAEGSGESGPFFLYFVDRPIENFARPEWVLVGRRGAPFSGENVQLSVVRISPKVILAERIAYRRRGNAYCQARAESRLYADPAVAASEADMIAVVTTMRSLAAIEQRGLCEVVEEAGPGQYRTRLFDVEGHRLPAAEGPETFRIVPRRPVPGS
jgi:hypothetical protein